MPSTCLYHIIKYTAQARRQDSVTGGAEINFGGAREVHFCEFERGKKGLWF